MKQSTLISKVLLGTTSLAWILGYGLTANAAGLTNVSLELALLIDASEGISEEDFYGQLDALSNIFNDDNFYNDFVLPLKGLEVRNHNGNRFDPSDTIVIDDPSVAISVFQFGTEFDPVTKDVGEPILEQIVDWTVFNEEHQSGIGQLNATKIGGVSPLSDVLLLIVNELDNNAYNGRRVTNLSSDGFNTYSPFSSTDLPNATRDAFLAGVTFNTLAIPINRPGGAEGSGEFYDVSSLTMISDRFSFLNQEHKNSNLTGNPAFLMTDYVTGQKTLEEAFRLKLGLETIGKEPPPVKPTGLDPESANVPEPSSLFGLLIMGLLALFPGNKKT